MKLTFAGGINEQDISLVDPSECIDGYNFELGFHNTHLNGRSPFDLIATATNGSQIRGFIQNITNADVDTTLVQAGDTVYEWDGQSTFTSRGTVSATSKLRGVNWTLGGYSVIVDIMKATVVKKWDGTSFTTLTTGLGVSLFAKYAVVYLGRMWLFNVTAGTNTPHLMVASAFENPESYDTSNRAKSSGFTTGNEAFFMVSPDLKPINGVAVWYDTLVISTESGQIWKLTGEDSRDFEWKPFYSGSAAIGNESMTSMGNDIIYMKKDGVIESLIATQNYGDTKADDLGRWVRTTTSGLTESITVYDQTHQKVYFFTEPNKLIVLFKDMLQTNLSPWGRYKTKHASSFDTEAAIYMRNPAGTNYEVYFGGETGQIYQMGGSGNGDSDSEIEIFRKSLLFEELEMEDGRILNPSYDIVRGRIFYRRISDSDLLMDFEWADDLKVQQCVIPLKGPSTSDGATYFGGEVYWGGAYYWNQGFQVSQRMSTKGFSAVGRGPGFNISLTWSSVQNLDVAKIEI